MIKYLNELFSKKVLFNNILFSPNDLNQIIYNNRLSLNSISSWISDDIYKNSVYCYGIPPEIKDLIDLPINTEPIYSDYIVGYGKYLPEKVNYLELGVSVGKNFYQIMNSFKSARLTAFDIEEINPVLESKMELINSIEYLGSRKSIKRNNFSIKDYKYNSNLIRYISADIWHKESWARLKNQKFNLIFSDALHDPKAILFEYEMIEKYQLLDKNFIMIWDDLSGDMREAFFVIANRLRKKYKLNSNAFYLVKVNGWLGQNYPLKHDVGFITTIDFNLNEINT